MFGISSILNIIPYNDLFFYSGLGVKEECQIHLQYSLSKEENLFKLVLNSVCLSG